MARITNAEQARIITEQAHEITGLRAELSVLRATIDARAAAQTTRDEIIPFHGDAPVVLAPSSKTYPTFTEASTALKRLAMSPINRQFKFKLTGTTVSATPR